MTRPWMEFSAVDASGDADAHAAYLRRIAALVAPIRAAVTTKLGIGPGTALLDAGCGLGEFAIELSRSVRPGGLVVGIDASRALIERAQSAARLAGADVDFQVASITDIPFPDASFDAVRSERVLQHLDALERETAAGELLRVLRPGGVLQVSDPDHRQWAVTASDRDLANLVTEFVGTRGRTPEAGLLNGGLLHAAGAVNVELATFPIVFDVVADWFNALALEGWIESLIEEGRCTAERAEAFFGDLAAREQAGVFRGVGVSYVNTARKAG